MPNTKTVKSTCVERHTIESSGCVENKGGQDYWKMTNSVCVVILVSVCTRFHRPLPQFVCFLAISKEVRGCSRLLRSNVSVRRADPNTDASSYLKTLLKLICATLCACGTGRYCERHKSEEKR